MSLQFYDLTHENLLFVDTMVNYAFVNICKLRVLTSSVSRQLFFYVPLVSTLCVCVCVCVGGGGWGRGGGSCVCVCVEHMLVQSSFEKHF